MVGSSFQRGWETEETWGGTRIFGEVTNLLEEIRDDINKMGGKVGENHVVINLEEKYFNAIKKLPNFSFHL